jgi:hypothetical protein
MAHPRRRVRTPWRALLTGTGLLTLALPASALRGQSRDSVLVPRTTLAPGVTWWQLHDARGPWRLSVARVDLRRRTVALRALHAQDDLTGRESPSAMARRHAGDSLQVHVALNADFFDLRTGASENNQVTDGTWWRGQMVTASPFDTYDNVHAQLAVAHDGRVSIDRYVLDGRAWLPGGTLPLLGVNTLPAPTPTAPIEVAAWYTAPALRTPPADSATAARRRDLVVRAAAMRGDTGVYVATAAAAAPAAQGTLIPAHGAVLLAAGDRMAALTAVRAGDTVRVRLGTRPALRDGRPPRQLLGGWPQIVAGGVNVAGDAPQREGTISRNAEARHPRSAVGVSRDGRTLWLVAVDGRSTSSVGMTLVELGERLRALGAWDALNLDGGGSTAMVVNQRLVTVPSDGTGERPVANVLLVVGRAGARR